MNKSAIALIAVVLATFNVAALAQDMRGVGLLALNTDDSRGGLADPGRSSLIETPDSGGGSGARALRGSDGAPTARASEPADGADALPSKASAPFDDPSQPAVPTPKRPTYRWQSLVPGAIK